MTAIRLAADIRQDIGLGLRLLARYKAFSAVSIATLGVAIGGNAAVFAVVNALLLTPPTVAEPANMVRVDTGQSLAAWPTYEDVRDRNAVFAGVAAFHSVSTTLDVGGNAIRLRGQVTSPNYFTVMRVPAERGRPYFADDGGFDRVVLAHRIWRQHFGSDPAIVGQTVRLGGRPFQVAAVMPDGFRGLMPPGVQLDFWFAADPDGAGLRNRLIAQWEVAARLNPSVGRDSATAALRQLAQRLRTEHPDLPESLLAIQATPVGGVNAFQGVGSVLLPVFAFLALLTVVSVSVLVIGCSNIAGLLVGRATMRQREIALRVSLGASRGRLLRQLLTESLVLALAGGAAGLVVTMGLVAIVRTAIARLPVSLDLDLSPDYRVLAYVLALSTATAVFFGLLPARRALHGDLARSLKTDSSGAPERQRLRRVMVLGQIAICSALMIWSLLFLRSLGRIHTIEPGFDPTGVMTGTVELDRGALSPERVDDVLTEWAQQVAASPGVQSAALANVVPLALTGREEFDVSLPQDPPGTRRRVLANRLTPGWFATVRIPLLAGRDFTWADREGTPAVAIVNDTLARQFWNGAALGQRIVFGGRSLEIVGVARDSKYRTLGEVSRPLVYLPIRQARTFFVTLHARTADLRSTARAMVAEFQRLIPGADVDVESMSDAVAVAVLPARIGAIATGAFGVLAVGLAACGVYGLVSFSVVQRTREIGIRRAIGATTADIMRLVVRQHTAIVGAGLVVGVTTGVLGAALLRAFLAGVGPGDPVTLLAAIILVGGCALAATTAPVLRATRVDPMAALRDG